MFRVFALYVAIAKISIMKSDDEIELPAFNKRMIYNH